jgi:hypothetical protein
MTASTNPSPDAHRWRPVDLDTARVCMARTLLRSGPSRDVPRQLGDIALLPHQRDAIVRLRETLARFHGALLADDVGLGKTYVALGVARDYDDVHVIAPAALLPMWRVAVERTGSKGVAVHSLHACSTKPPNIPPLMAGRGLVVIDEAHHLRVSTTRRYRAVASAVVGRDVLLLSATPIHNRPRELRAQLGLFMSARDDLLDPEMLAQLIVRRTSEFVSPSDILAWGQADASRVTPPGRRRPRICEGPPFHVPHDPATLTGILALPSPLPTHDGAAAGALIRLGLLRAWCSSDGAFDAALVRRLLRGSALRDALLAGRHPTTGELRAWVVGDHREMQLAFPELVTATMVSPSRLLPVLGLHVEALSALQERHRRVAQGDDARAGYLRETLNRHAGVSLVAFSQFSGTVHSLYRALSDIAGVGMLTGSGARIASGRISRREMIARFAPRAQGLPPPPAHGAVRLLLATDLLAEGVNLQDAGVVVHLDLPWTDALRHQRVGRLARLGSDRDEVYVYAIHPPACGERALRQLERLRTKAGFGARLVGSATPSSAADHASILRRTLQSWSCEEAPSDASALTGDRERRVRREHEREIQRAHGRSLVAAVPAGRRLALALAGSGSTWQLLVCDLDAPGAKVSDLAVDVADCLRLIDRLASPSCRLSPALLRARVEQVETLVADWLSTRGSRAQAGAAPGGLSTAQRRALERIRGALAATSPLHRGALAHVADRASAAVESAAGAAAERALECWLTSFTSTAAAAWLQGWMRWPALRGHPGRSAACGPDREAPLDAGAGSIRALVLLEPSACR